MKKGLLKQSFKMMGLAFLLTVCSVKVNAQEELRSLEHMDAPVYQDGYMETQQRQTMRTSSNAKAAIMAGLTSFSSEIPLAQYNIPTSQISALYSEIINDNPSMFYIEGGFSYYVSGNNVYSLMPRYAYPVAEIPAKIAVFESEIAKTLQSVKSGMTTPEKLLAIHDTLVADIEYGFTDAPASSSRSESYSAYGAIVNKIAVCNGYTLAMTELCKRIGVESKYVISRNMNHAWNLVLIDGEWYHIDATWDDPVPNKEGRVYHSYFLISDANISLKNHYDWAMVQPVTATSTKYESEFWKDVTTKIIYNNNKWYYVDKATGTTHDIKAYTFANKTATTIKSVYARWLVWGNTGSYWRVGPALATYNNKLYYSTNDKIVSMNFDGSGVVERSIDVSTGYIYGIGVHGNTMKYELAQSPNGTAVVYEYSLLNSRSVASRARKSLVESVGLPFYEIEYEMVTE